MTRLTREAGTAAAAFALIVGLVSPPAVASGLSAWPCQWGMYGANPARTFSYDVACGSDINPLTVAAMVPKWVKKTPATVTASPAVVDGVVYVGDWSGKFYALDADDGREVWPPFPTAPSPGAAFGPIVSSAAVAEVEIDGRATKLVIFGAGPRLYALSAVTGTAVWIRDVGTGNPNEPTEIESSPVVWGGRIYVGMSTHNDEVTGVRGGLLVLDAATGSTIWKFEPLGLNGRDGGCGGIWSSPVLDTANDTVFVGFANCTADEPEFEWGPHTEAIVALDATPPTTTPVVKWSFQPHTRFNHADWDFGATPNLFRDANNRLILGAGNKNGTYYALDPASGSLLWSADVANGDPVNDDFAIGGFIGSPAIWNGNVYGGTAIGGPPYYHAISGTDGSNAWLDFEHEDKPLRTGGLAAPSYAASAAVNGVVFAGALDNLFKAFDTATGRILWAAPLLGPISSGAAIVGNDVFVGSGTSSSDACVKDASFFTTACLAVFDTVLGSTGGIHAFQLPIPDYPY